MKVSVRHVSTTCQYDISVRNFSTCQYDISLRHVSTTFQYDMSVRHFSTTCQYDISARHVSTTFQYISVRHVIVCENEVSEGVIQIEYR